MVATARATAEARSGVDRELGEPLEFDSFYRREYPAMVALASTIIGGSGEDIAQEAMLRAHRKWRTVSGYERPGAWVRRVTINLASSGRRRRAIELRARLRLLGDRPEAPRLQPADHELRAALLTLPTQQRAAIALHYLEDRPVADIAEILECAPATARVHLHRGRAALAQVLDPEGDRR